jgi:hypothetical protein
MLPFSSGTCHAENANFARASLHYHDYRSLIQERSGHQFIQGEAISFTLEPGAEKFFNKPFLIRLFRVDGAGHDPEPVASFRPCLVFLSAPYVFKDGVQGAVVRIGLTENINWLHPMPNGQLEDGRFLLVFEPLADKDAVLRLDQQSSAAYFAAGIYIEVTRQPGKRYPSEETMRIAQQNDAYLQTLFPKANKNSREFHCYRGTFASNGQFSETQLLTSCDAPPSDDNLNDVTTGATRLFQASDVSTGS